MANLKKAKFASDLSKLSQNPTTDSELWTSNRVNTTDRVITTDRVVENQKVDENLKTPKKAAVQTQIERSGMKKVLQA